MAVKLAHLGGTASTQGVGKDLVSDLEIVLNNLSEGTALRVWHSVGGLESFAFSRLPRAD